MLNTTVGRVGAGTAKATLNLTQSLLDNHRERITGTRSCLQAGHEVAGLLARHCDRVFEEPFDEHPGSLWNVGRVMAVTYALAALLLFVGGDFVWAASAVCVIGLVYGQTHYVRCGKLFDGLYPRTEGCNAGGVIEPAGEARKQVLFVGHHDGPYVLSFLLGNQALAAARLVWAIRAYLLLTALSIGLSIMRALGVTDWPLRGWLLLVVLAGLVLVAPLFSLITKIPSPGAGDNLNASAMAIKLAELFARRREAGTPLRHTRLVLLSTDGEEAGQRGAIAYAERHKAELLAIPTFVLNVDSVYKLEDLAAVVRDRNGTIALSARMAAECSRIAADLGIQIKEISLPLGGGSTDAAAFAAIGVEATSIIGIPTKPGSTGLVYHTPHDTVDRIEPAAVEAVLDVAFNFVLRRDGDGG